MIKRRIKRQTLKYKLSESEKLEMNSTICVVFLITRDGDRHMSV